MPHTRTAHGRSLYYACQRQWLITAHTRTAHGKGLYYACQRQWLITTHTRTAHGRAYNMHTAHGRGLYVYEDDIICERTHRPTANDRDLWCRVMDQVEWIAVGTCMVSGVAIELELFDADFLCYPRHFKRIGRYMTNQWWVYTEQQAQLTQVIKMHAHAIKIIRTRDDILLKDLVWRT